MEYIHEKTMKTFIKKELIDGLEMIIERNHIKLKKKSWNYLSEVGMWRMIL